MFSRSRRRRSRRLTLVSMALAVLVSCAVSTAAAQAAPACDIHGTILEGDLSGPENITVHGNTVIDEFTHPIFFDGSMSGVGIAEERNVIHLQNGTAEVHARIAFTGAVTCADGRVLGAGGLEINFNATADFAANSFTGHFQVIGSSGGLAGTQGNGTLSGVPGVPGGNGPYDGTLH